MTQKRILAVEDNDIFASYLEAALTDLGYSVLQAATSGEEAIARAKAQKPDLILMDIELAGEMNGIATADRIQSFLDVPIIYLTSHSGSSVLEQARATAPYGYLVKPVSRQDLSAAIEMALYRHALDVRLKESESRLKMALASAHMGVWEWDGRTNDMFGSPESYEILGLRSMSGTFESFAKLLHPEDAPALRAAVEQISIDHPLFRAEFRFIRPDGEVRWLASSGQGYFDDTGALVRMIGTVQDITERRTVEENLRASRLQLAEAADMAMIAYWELDETKGEFTVNDAFYNLYGTTAEQEGGYRMPREKYGRTFVHPADRKELQRQIAANRGTLPRADKLEQYEHRGLRKDGEVIHILTRNRVITDSEGHALKTVGVNQDITARKKMVDALRESETKLRAILEGSRDAIAVLKDERHIFVNPAYVSLFGYGSAGELIDAPASELIAPESRGLAEEMASKRAPDDPAPSLVELTALRKDGTTFLMESSVSVYALKGEQFALVILRDITEKKRLEEQLSQAQKMEAVGTLAGGVAHDFNNILTVIMGLANLMQMSIGRDDIHRPYVDQIVASSERAADLTQSLLAFSRKQRITLEHHKLNGVVTSTAKLLRRLLPEDIGLTVNLTDKDTSSLLDITQIGQVLMNLATNARDAMPHGGSLTITTSRAKMDEDFIRTNGFGRQGNYVRLTVSDTGSGMDEETVKRIFEPFFTTKEVGKGTGLGLASAYGTVKQHNGYITVSSSPFKGTVFDIYLPYRRTPSVHEAPSKGEIRGGGETILIVEDDADVRNMLTKILGSQGYATIEAVDGDDAVRVHGENRERIDLIITDVVMPGKNGKETLDEITRADPRAKAIFVSGYTGDVIIDKGIQSESVDFLQKPLSVTALLAKVREVLDR